MEGNRGKAHMFVEMCASALYIITLHCTICDIIDEACNVR